MPADLLDCPAETALDRTAAHLTLVCLTPGASHQPDLLASRVTAQLAPHTTTRTIGHTRGHTGGGARRAGDTASGSPALICPNRFTAPADLPDRARALLINPRPASVPGLLRCAGGPIGLLDFTVYPSLTEQVAAHLHTVWEHAVAGTPDALPWRAFCDPYDRDERDDPDQAQRLVDAFFDQPRVAAISDHLAAGLLPPDPTELGPSLEAHQRGRAAYVAHLTLSVLYSDALVTTDGRLLTPDAARRPPYAHTLAERGAYFAAARAYLAPLDPGTVLVGAHCRL